jgi:hypothetical protein
MSKFERINSNRFGASQFRSIKQLVEYQKQETEREKIPKEQPLCCEQYINPFIQSNHCNHHCVATSHPGKQGETIECVEECVNNKEHNESVTEPIIEHPMIYPDKETDLKPVEMQQEIENIRSEFVRKQSLKDVVKLSYKTFLKKEPSFM